MFGQKWFEEITLRIREVSANSPARDLEKNMRSVIASAFSKLDLVTREEFDVQQEVLVRTRERLAVLEARLTLLETRVFPASADEPVDLKVMQDHA